MRRWRASLAFGLAVALVAPAAIVAQKKDDKKLDENQKREQDAVLKLVDDAASGQATPNDFSLTWAREDFLKAGDKKEFVPFVMTVDPAKVTAGSNLVIYWRVVPQGWTPAPAAPADSKDKKDKDKDKDKKAAPPNYPWESIGMVAPAAGSGPTQIARSVTIPAGKYDVYVALKEPASAQKNAPMAKASVIKHSLNVPDFWNNEFNTSSVILAQRLDPLPAPLTQQQLVERPYAALGGLEIVPRLDTKFSKKEELSTYMLVYNPKPDAMNKPNVTVEYNFCQIAPGTQPKEGEPCKAGEKFFNKTTPQNFNAETLPPQFDLSMGHQVQAGQAVPLTSFPEGEYRLEIKLTDKNANKTVIKDVPFTVTAS